jgi:hypothetical protein
LNENIFCTGKIGKNQEILIFQFYYNFKTLFSILKNKKSNQNLDHLIQVIIKRLINFLHQNPSQNPHLNRQLNTIIIINTWIQIFILKQQNHQISSI